MEFFIFDFEVTLIIMHLQLFSRSHLFRLRFTLKPYCEGCFNKDELLLLSHKLVFNFGLLIIREKRSSKNFQNLCYQIMTNINNNLYEHPPPYCFTHRAVQCLDKMPIQLHTIRAREGGWNFLIQQIHFTRSKQILSRMLVTVNNF